MKNQPHLLKTRIATPEAQTRQIKLLQGRMDNLQQMITRIDMEFSLVVTKLREKGILPDR